VSPRDGVDDARLVLRIGARIDGLGRARRGHQGFLCGSG
jgi:hypothetical protein